MERVSGLYTRRVQFPAGGPAQIVRRLDGLFGEVRSCFSKCIQRSQDIPPKAGIAGLVAFQQEYRARLPPLIHLVSAMKRAATIEPGSVWKARISLPPPTRNPRMFNGGVSAARPSGVRSVRRNRTEQSLST